MERNKNIGPRYAIRLRDLRGWHIVTAVCGQCRRITNLNRSLVVRCDHKIPFGRVLWHDASCARASSIEVSAADRDRLERIVADRNSRQKHAWRARIILATAEGCGHGRDHAPGRRVQALGVALAGAVHARGRGRSPARQDEEARPAAPWHQPWSTRWSS